MTRGRVVVAAMALFLLVAAAQVLSSTNALTAAKRLPGCPAVGIVELQGGDGIGAAVAGWHAFDRAATDPTAAGDMAVESDVCAIPGELPDTTDQTSGRLVARNWLAIDAFAFVPLYAGVLAWLMWRTPWRRLGVVAVAVAVVADEVENLVLALAVDDAWDAAVRGVAYEGPGGVLAAAEVVKWAAVVAVGLIGVAALVRLPAGAWPAARRGVSALRLAWVQAAVVVVWVVALVLVPQSVDAVRRWGVGQALGTAVVAMVFAALVALTAAGAFRPPTEGDGEVDTRAARGDFYGPTRGLVILAGVGVAFWLVSVPTGWRGLWVPGTIFLLAAVVSMFGPATVVEPVARREREPEAVTRRRHVIGAGLGALVLFGVGLAAVKAASTDLLASSALVGRQRWLLALGLVLVASAPWVGWGLLVLADRVAALAVGPSRRVLAAVVGLLAALAALLMIDGVALAVSPVTGSVAVVALFLGGVCVVSAAGEWITEWLTHGTVRYDIGLPPVLRRLGLQRAPVAGLIVVWFAAASFVDPGGYHDVRTLPVADPVAPTSLDAAVADWLARDRSAMVFVSASGGGIRAAYWTAAVLDCVIERDTVGDDPCGGDADAATADARRAGVFLASGVSGGSLGIVGYVADADRARDWYDGRFDDDFLAPTVTGLLFADLVQGLLRDDDGPDRAALLERSWERSWPDGELEAGFLATEVGDGPVMLLNGFTVESGCRFAVTPLSTNADRGAGDCLVTSADGVTVLDATTDVHDALCPGSDVRLSTAALLSARFPYVTPSGRVACDGTATAVVDGGYLESSAAAPVVELLPAVEALLPECVETFHVQIDNAAASDPARGTDVSPEELFVPPLAINVGRDGRNAAARTAVARLFGDRSITITTRAQPGTQAPLGWVLSPLARQALRDQLEVNREEIERLRAVLDGTAGDAPGCG